MTDMERKIAKAAASKKYRNSHKEQVAVSMHNRYLKHKDEISAKTPEQRETKAAYDKIYRAGNEIEIAVREKGYCATRKDEIAARQKAYDATHKEQKAATDKAHRIAHPEEHKERDRIRNASNRDKSAAYRAEHGPELKIAHAEYMKKNPEKRRLSTAKRRALKYGNTPLDEMLTSTEWLAILAEANGHCAYCDKEAKLTLDHVIPLSKGGKHSKDNVVPACGHCNDSKGIKTLEEWVSSVMRTVDKVPPSSKEQLLPLSTVPMQSLLMLEQGRGLHV